MKDSPRKSEQVRLLLIDDTPSQYATLLQQQGYTVVTATSQHARTLIAAQPWDLVLLAAELANGNGFGLCAELRERMGHHVIIVLLLADDTPLRRVTAMQLGADDVVGVPYDEHELLARIEAHRRRRAADTA